MTREVRAILTYESWLEFLSGLVEQFEQILKAAHFVHKEFVDKSSSSPLHKALLRNSLTTLAYYSPTTRLLRRIEKRFERD